MSSETANPANSGIKAQLDNAIGRNGRIGLVVLSSDQVGERAFGRIVEKAGIDYFTTRIRYRPKAEVTDPDQEDREIIDAVRLILPEAGLDFIAYSCTSRSAEMGEQAMLDLLSRARPAATSTTPLTASLAAFRRLSAQRVAVISPYARPVHDAVVRSVEDAGLTVPRSFCFELTDGTDFARLTPQAIVAAGNEINGPDIDAIFVSCTGIRGVDAIDGIEQSTGRPVVTSSQALAWHSLGLMGAGHADAGPGRLFALT